MDDALERRVSHEADAESALANKIGDLMAEAALPGVFASGKTVVGSESGLRGNQMFITFRFDDGSDMTIIGDYQVLANQAGAEERDLVEEGNRLMRGEDAGT